jgi:hypothetical protein
VLTAKILSLTLPKSDVFEERKLSLTLKTPSEIRFWQVLCVLESIQRWALDIQNPAAKQAYIHNCPLNITPVYNLSRT